MNVVSRHASVMLFLAIAAVGTVEAQTVFYNGDPYKQGGNNSQHFDAPSQSRNAMVYDSFVVGGNGWSISGMFGHFIQTGQTARTSADWEIRTGMANGNGGTLLQSGTGAPLSWTATNETFVNRFGVTFFGFLGEISGLSIALAPGTYWMGLSPRTPANEAQTIYASLTRGLNGINANIDYTQIRDFPLVGEHFEQITFNVNGISPDVAYGLRGVVTTVPEPSTLWLLVAGMAGIGLSASRRKSRR